MAKNKNSDPITVFTILFLIMIEFVKNHPCDVNLENDQLKANCDSRNLTQIPNDLGETIRVLDVSYNNLKEITKNSLAKYEKLVQFRCKSFKLQSLSISPDAFKDLHYLQVLQIGNYNFGRIMLFLPYGLIEIEFTRTLRTSDLLEISHLSQLKIVELNDNSLNKLPQFHRIAPLNVINISNNPLTTISALQLSRYCHLTVFVFEFPKNMPLYYNFCPCSQLRQWISWRKIKGMNMTHYRCVPDSECEESNITEVMLKRHENCMNNVQDYFDVDDENISVHTPGIKSLITGFVILNILILIIVGIYLITLGSLHDHDTSPIEKDDISEMDESELTMRKRETTASKESRETTEIEEWNEDEEEY